MHNWSPVRSPVQSSPESRFYSYPICVHRRVVEGREVCFLVGCCLVTKSMSFSGMNGGDNIMQIFCTAASTLLQVGVEPCMDLLVCCPVL